MTETLGWAELDLQTTSLNLLHELMIPEEA